MALHISKLSLFDVRVLLRMTRFFFKFFKKYFFEIQQTYIKYIIHLRNLKEQTMAKLFGFSFMTLQCRIFLKNIYINKI